MKRCSLFLVIFALMFGLMPVSCGESGATTKKTAADVKPVKKRKPPKDANKEYAVEDHKIIVYQMMTRLFANTKTVNKKFGTMEENGVGKFNDINDKALVELKKLGISHVWYTGVIEHMVMADYTKYGIAMDDGDWVKGRAGSPYAIKDYYDVNPDLAVNVKKRMSEFEELVKRTHKNGLKVIIDFVPNHVARGYKSDAKPKGVKDLGEDDDTTKVFAPNNNFYYIPGKALKLPKVIINKKFGFSTIDGENDENPAKWTGNHDRPNNPSMNDWYETVRLNYGVDFSKGRKKNFDPIPSTWKKMVDILIFWAEKDVDGFRCDMAEMVPVEFWGWAIPQVKKVKPSIKFIAEIYNPSAYKSYIKTGKFDYLYDKVGLYDSIKPLIKKNNKSASTGNVYYKWKQVRGYNWNMLTFLENHDEQRTANKSFSKDPWNAIPGMIVSATLYAGPVMIYFGQEVGEPAANAEGYGGKDGRTTIFDYWGVPEHQKWVNGGKFDGGGLSADQKKLRATYATMFDVCQKNEAIRKGNTYELSFANKNKQSEGWDSKKMLAYIRYTKAQQILVVANFQRVSKKNPDAKPGTTYIKIPEAGWTAMGLDTTKKYKLVDLMGSGKVVEFDASATLDRENEKAGIPVVLDFNTAYVFAIQAVTE